jgi:hypothetical protein
MKVQAWFNPADGFRYVGGPIHRYLMGSQQVTFVSQKCGTATGEGREVVPSESPH